MGVKDRLARANWELNCLFRTGRVPQYRAPTPYYSQSASHAGRQTVCRTCGSQLSYGSAFCDRCGARVT